MSKVMTEHLPIMRFQPTSQAASQIRSPLPRSDGCLGSALVRCRVWKAVEMHFKRAVAYRVARHRGIYNPRGRGGAPCGALPSAESVSRQQCEGAAKRA